MGKKENSYFLAYYQRKECIFHKSKITDYTEHFYQGLANSEAQQPL